MKYQSINDFETEIEEMREKLAAETGREVPRHEEIAVHEGGISCDFELPYSSLPTLAGPRWATTG